jgi:hypothetical protein
MEINMPKIPFGWMPGSWGLKGRTREIAQAEYELTGFELEEKLLQLKEPDLDDLDYRRRMIELRYKHKKMDEAEYHKALASLIQDEGQRKLALLEIDYREGKLGELEYNKQLATLKGEPWVNVVNMDFTKKSALEGSFELDWNEHFVEKLKTEGYTGPTPDNIVNQWFMELCRNIAMEEFDGTGDFTADSEANLEAVKRWGAESESLGKGRKGYK